MLPKIEDDFDKTRELAPNEADAFAREADPDALSAGTLAGAYVLKKPLASGGGGTVYEAQHRMIGRSAAVKVLRRELAGSPQMVARFLREALAVNLIKHPNIVDIYEFGELADGRPFYVMELLEGTDLRSMLSERGRFTPEEVLGILEPVCSALGAAHAQGIVHRDLKASNIHVLERGGERVVKLLDFGIAKLMRPDAGDAGLTVVGTRLGTSYTMAPEQIRAEAVDQRTDVYALGVVLYHLVTGQYPFRAEHMTDIERLHLEAPVPRPSQSAPVPPALDAVVLRAMEKQADKRFPNVEAFIEALRAAVGVASASPAATMQAVGIYVEVRVAETADGDSDEVLDDVSNALDVAEQRLRGGGWLLPLQTGNAILGAQLVAGPDAMEAACAEARATAQALCDELAGRDGALADVHVNVSLHADKVEVKDSAEAAGGKEIVGGELTSVGNWAPSDDVDGVHVSGAIP